MLNFPRAGLGFWFFTVAWGIAGCGSSNSGPGGKCSQKASCGGTIVPGTYDVTSYCAYTDPVAQHYDEICESELPNGCPATWQVTSTDLSGTVIFTESGDVQSDAVAYEYRKWVVPASCKVKDCHQLEAVFAETTPDLEYAGVTCSGTGGCVCERVDRGVLLSIFTGEYGISGRQLWMGSTFGIPVYYDYCVSGEELTLVRADQLSPPFYASAVLTRRQ